MLDAIFEPEHFASANDAWGLISSLTSCGSHPEIQAEFSSKLAGWGGPRPNSGGARPNSGGARSGAGRPRKPVQFHPPANVVRWYLLEAFRGQTRLADKELRRADYTIFAPTEFKPATPSRRYANGVIRPGKPDRVDFLFGRFIFVSLNLAEPSWRDVLRCDGVERIICEGHFSGGMIGLPIAVPDKAIMRIRELLGPDGCMGLRDKRIKRLRQVPIEPRTCVRVIRGPAAGREFIVELSDGLRVELINLLGGPTLKADQSDVIPV